MSPAEARLALEDLTIGVVKKSNPDDTPFVRAKREERVLKTLAQMIDLVARDENAEQQLTSLVAYSKEHK